jgi:hypothetical protein
MLGFMVGACRTDLLAGPTATGKLAALRVRMLAPPKRHSAKHK